MSDDEFNERFDAVCDEDNEEINFNEPQKVICENGDVGYYYCPHIPEILTIGEVQPLEKPLGLLFGKREK